MEGYRDLFSSGTEEIRRRNGNKHLAGYEISDFAISESHVGEPKALRRRALIVDSDQAAGGATPNLPWYALHTKPRQEDRVSRDLAERGLEVFLPKIQVRRKRRGHGIFRVEPLFPGYLFVASSLTAPVWHAVRWTPGVKAVLGCDGVPSSVPDGPMALIMQRAGAGGLIQPQPAFGQGDRVRITGGPFVGLVGILERGVSRSGRVQVLLDILRGATVELEDVDLELAS